MQLRQHFLQTFSKLEDDYQSLRKLAEFDVLKTMTNTKSTESIKRTSRTGCSEIVSQLSQLAEPVETHFIEQTFCGVENLETSNIPMFGSIAFKIVFDECEHTISIPSYESFEHLVRQIEQVCGKTLSEQGVNNVIEGIKRSVGKSQNQLKQNQDNIERTERAQPSVSPSKTPRKKVKPLQATVTRLNRKMVIQYALPTMNQDIELFCITHKLPARAKKLIAKALTKGQRMIGLSE